MSHLLQSRAYRERYIAEPMSWYWNNSVEIQDLGIPGIYIRIGSWLRDPIWPHTIISFEGNVIVL